MDEPGTRSPVPAWAQAPETRKTRSGAGWKIAIAVGALFVFGFCATLAITFSAMLGTQPLPTTGDAVALIHIDRVIAGTGSVYEGYVTPEHFIEQLDAAEADPSVRAILLRIDSPGGTIAASQEIAMEVARASKPIVVSVGDVCASGAYLIASQCDEIFATPTSSIGSIGVIAQIPNIEGLLETLGVEFTVLTAGEYKDAGSPFRTLTATETALFQEWVDMSYDEFVRIVAEGRGLEVAVVEEMATGWLWPGTVAKEMGLIDQLGTYSDALARAAELGGIEGEPTVVTFVEPELGDLLRGMIGFGARFGELGIESLQADAVRQSLPR